MNTPLERYGEGQPILVKREDLHPSGFHSGKLRGVLPYFQKLKEQGVRLVVNAGATHSNSHAIVSYAAKAVGLDAVSFVNTNNIEGHPALAAAVLAGNVQIKALRPMHLGPLRAKAEKWAYENGGKLLAWGMVDADIVTHYADAVGELPRLRAGTIHVVPFGAGGWAAGVWLGLQRYGRTSERVYAVPVMPTAGDGDRLRRAIGIVAPGGGFGLARDKSPPLPKDIQLIEPWQGATITEPPFPCDPKYEWPAWFVAKSTRSEGEAVVFWSIGQAVAGTA